MDFQDQKKLHIWRTIRGAIEFYRGHWSILQGGILLGTILGGLSLYFLDIPQTYSKQGGPSFYEILSGAAMIVQGLISLIALDIFLSLAISCHRLILLNNAHDAYHQGFLQGIREFNFSSLIFGELFQKHWTNLLKELNFFCFFLLFYLGANLLLFLGQWGGDLLSMNWDNSLPMTEHEASARIIIYLTIFPAFFYFLGRFSFVFLALVIDETQGTEWSWQEKLEWSWNKTAGYGWRLALLVGSVPTISWILYQCLAILGFQQLIFLDSYLQSFLWFFFAPIIEVAILTIAFRDLTNWKSPTLHSEETVIEG
jgi:hypothetical protein